MFGEFEMRELPLSLSSSRKRVESFLKAQELRFDEMECFCAVFDQNENIIAGGGLDRDIIKCLAVAEEARSESLTNSIVSRLRQIACENGFFHTKVFTKHQNLSIFKSLGYHLVGDSADAILLESDPRGIASYVAELSKLKREGKNGIIIMNCNPLTKGHEYLISVASSKVDNLYIIPLSDSGGDFSLDERRDMFLELAKKFKNVIICPTSEYVISSTTFPTYFLKEIGKATDSQIKLDINIFLTHIAPALDVSVRFVGSEPIDPLTGRYNELLKEKLVPYNIDLIEIPRKLINDEPISASRVRKAISDLDAGTAFAFVSDVSVPYVLSHLAARALRIELDLTPKPGLVDRNNSGSHKDMDYALMSKSIDTLVYGFTKLALAGYQKMIPLHEDIVRIGVRTEKEMFSVTEGVNTHKGALFSLGLAIVSTAHLIFNRKDLSAGNLIACISHLAGEFSSPADTNGAKMRAGFSIPGALDYAASGYDILFSTWIPFLREKNSYHDLLLKIISTLEDTNIYYRAGSEGAAFAKSRAKEMLGCCNEHSLTCLDAEFIRRNISPGGAADMFALTIFLNSIVK